MMNRVSRRKTNETNRRLPQISVLTEKKQERTERGRVLLEVREGKGTIAKPEGSAAPFRSTGDDISRFQKVHIKKKNQYLKESALGGVHKLRNA